MIFDWLQHIEFKNYWLLPLLLALPVIAWFYLRTPSWRKAAFKVTSSEAFRVKTIRAGMVNLPFWIKLIAIGCLILALARPRLRQDQTRTKGEGIDIVLCMDVSGSMLAGDFIPTRLAVAKQMAIDFVKGRPVDQIGLVIFSGESYTQFPLSTDHEGLLEQIEALRSGMLKDGTVIGEGLATAVQRLSSSASRSKIVILLTDGNEQAPETRIIDPLTAMEIARARSVKVYTIGMASEGARTTSAGSDEIAYLDEKLLTRIASATGGEYFRATDKKSLNEIYDQIDRLEKSEVEVVTRIRYEEQFMFPIIAALFFLFLDFILRYTYLRTFP